MFYATLCTLTVIIALTLGSPFDYCNGICGNNSVHVLCAHQVAGAAESCTGYIRDPLSVEEKERILTRLNARRSKAAMGLLANFPPASNMMKLVTHTWSVSGPCFERKEKEIFNTSIYHPHDGSTWYERWVEDLAVSAQRWADQCVPPSNPEKLDQCRDLFAWTAGQAVASITGDAPGLLIEILVEVWNMQSLHFKGNITYYKPSKKNKEYFGGFAQMMWAKTYMVGCGRSRFMIEQGSRHVSVYRLVCNFAPRGCQRNKPIWMPGDPCVRCPAGTTCFKDDPGLCHYRNKTQDELGKTEIINRSSKRVESRNSSRINSKTTEVTLAEVDLKQKTRAVSIEYTTNVSKNVLNNNREVVKDLTTVEKASINLDPLEHVLNMMKNNALNRKKTSIPKKDLIDDDGVNTLPWKLDPNNYFNRRPAVSKYEVSTETNTDNNTSQYDYLSTEENDKDYLDYNDLSYGNATDVKNKSMLANLYSEIEKRRDEINILLPSTDTQTETYPVHLYESTETRNDFHELVRKAERDHARQPAHIKVRRAVHENQIDIVQQEAARFMTSTYPPFLEKLIKMFPFLEYAPISSSSNLSGSLGTVCLLLGLNLLR